MLKSLYRGWPFSATKPFFPPYDLCIIALFLSVAKRSNFLSNFRTMHLLDTSFL